MRPRAGPKTRILAAAGLVSLSSALVLSLVAKKPLFKTQATLVRMPPTFATDLHPGVLGVRTYRQLFESEQLLQEVQRRLVERGVFGRGRALRLGRDVEVRILVSEQDDLVVLGPILDVIVHSTSREGALAIAESCIEVFQEHMRWLTVARQESTLKMIDRQFQAQQFVLEDLEDERVSLWNEQQRQVDVAEIRWNQDFLKFQEEYSALYDRLQEETARRMEASADRFRRTARAELGALPAELAAEIGQLTALRTRLAQTPRRVERKKFLTGASHGASGVSPMPVLDRWEMDTDEVNPFQQALVRQVAVLRMEVQSSLEKRLEATLVRRWMRELEILQWERQGHLAALTDERRLNLARLKTERRQHLRRVRRKSDVQLERLTREIEEEKRTHEMLAEKALQVSLAESEGERLPDVQIGARPVTAERLEVGAAVWLLRAALVAALVSLVWVVVHTVPTPHRWSPRKDPPGGFLKN